MLTLLAGFRAETMRLRAIVGKKPDSIWSMNKAELVEVAVKELSMPYQQAMAETVITLRERIRRARAGEKAMKDPMAQVPVKLDRMLHADLVKECEGRDISTVDPLSSKTKTRPQMIVDIRDDVSRRSSTSLPSQMKKETAVPSRKNTSARPRPAGDDDLDMEDWEMSFAGQGGQSLA